MKNLNLKPLVLILIVVGLITLVFLLVRNLTFRNLTFLDLPADSTVVAIEWSADFRSEELKQVSRKINFPTTVQLVNLETQYFSPKLLDPILKNQTDLVSKTFAIIKTQNQLSPVLIYNYADSSFLNRMTSLPGLAYFVQNNKLYLSQNPQALNLILSAKRQVKTIPRFQDAIANLPKFNILDFYLNHELFKPQDLSGVAGLFESINQKLGVTVGALRSSDLGLVFSTYTNESSQTNTGFPVTRTKYNPTIPEYLNDNQLVFFSGVNVAERLNKLVDNRDLAAEILSYLNSYNLSPEALRIVTKILNAEFAISYDNEKNLSLLFKKLNPVLKSRAKEELSRLAAYFNPVKKPYKLEDGTQAQVLTPAEDYEPESILPNTFQFNLESLDTNIYLGQNVPKNLDYISTSLNPFMTLSSSGQLLSENKFFAESMNALLPIADEVLYLNKEFIYPYFKLVADPDDIPNLMTTSNFFNDGIQTVTLMAW